MVFAPDNLASMLVQLQNVGYLVGIEGRSGYFVTGKGWERIAELRKPGRDSNHAFVAMWFDDSRTNIFDNGIKPAIEADGITKAFRVDRKEHNNKIDDEIIAAIRQCRYLVADYTGERGAVSYEAGYANGLGLPVIHCVDELSKEAMHFDTRQYSHIIYSNADDLRVKLINRIRATILPAA